MRKKERKRENVCEREGENEEVRETGSREENERERARASTYLTSVLCICCTSEIVTTTDNKNPHVIK